jgi:hypothetical protein
MLWPPKTQIVGNFSPFTLKKFPARFKNFFKIGPSMKKQSKKVSKVSGIILYPHLDNRSGTPIDLSSFPSSFRQSLNPRMTGPKPLPNSGRRLPPKGKKAAKKLIMSAYERIPKTGIAALGISANALKGMEIR